ncbi:Ppx/GppA phosphatase family protein [Ammonicoccus fulvus]|uniref:Ppx/GppA phosphatase family protein n=1 Tax=Ammonicoccus fulvus TaxID=3138240 RepID=A0ABZ3FVA0_9ACTN
MNRRFAAVDCGTNALRWLIAEQRGDGVLEPLERELRLVRLGEGVDATGRFAPAAVERTLAALDECADRIRGAGVQGVRFVATSAARDVSNADEFLAAVSARLGLPAEIIDGTEEAALSFTGALAGVPEPDDPVLITDVGGGSTELVVGTAGRIELAVSLDIGSVRLTERFWSSDPPSTEDVARATAFVDAQLSSMSEVLAGVRSWVAVGGTATTLAALQLGLDHYDSARVQGAELTGDSLAALADRLAASRSAELVSELMPPLRAQVIAAGALICHRIQNLVGDVPCIVSETDILDGIVIGLLER